MHPAVKILIGALMVVVGIYSSLTFSTQLIELLQGGLGPLLIVLGAFLIWLESDEWKMMREDSGSDRSVQQQFQPANQDEVQEEVKEQVETSEETEEEEEKHACPDCGKEFDTERGMKIHYSQKHE